jgi:hypothetical protein
MQQPALKNKQAKSVSRPKSALTRTKPKTTINIPTGKSQQSMGFLTVSFYSI